MWGKRECQGISRRLWDYAEGRLPDAEAGDVTRHLETCRACRKEAEACRYARELTVESRRQAIPPSETTWQELRWRLEAETQTTGNAPARWRRLAPAWGGALAVTMLALMWISRAQHGRLPLVAKHPEPSNETRVVVEKPSPPPNHSDFSKETPIKDTHTSTPIKTARHIQGAHHPLSLHKSPMLARYTPHYLQKPEGAHALPAVSHWRRGHPKMKFFAGRKKDRSAFPNGKDEQVAVAAVLTSVDGDLPESQTPQRDFVLNFILSPDVSETPLNYVMGRISLDTGQTSAVLFREPTKEPAKEMEAW